MFHRRILKKQYVIDAEDAHEWIEKSVDQSPTQKELDELRLQEISTLDMMATAGIIYHCESVTEM